MFHIFNIGKFLLFLRAMFLGIDPGVRKLGYALIDKNLKIHDAGILLQDTPKPSRMDYFDKMRQIRHFFEDIFANHTIKSVGIEKVFFTRFNQANAEFVFGIRAVLILLAQDYKATIQEYTPNELKKAITGHGKAQKILMQTMIQRIFQLEELPTFDDSADALGLAYLASCRSLG